MADLKQNIIELLQENYQNYSKEALQEIANQAIQKLEELQNYFKKSTYNNTASERSIYRAGHSKYNWDETLYRIKKKEFYPEILKIITEILDILRGEPLTIDVYKTEKNDKGQIIKITHYHGKEAELSFVSKKSKYGKYITEEIGYVKDNLEKEEIYEKARLSHFENFENIAISHFQEDKNFNEGHIIEAYQRHLSAVQHNESFKDKIEPSHVAIMLYYSINNDPWWVGGDVGMSQIKKYNNSRLASQKSIRMVANRLIHMAQNPENFKEDFINAFTQSEINDMANYEALSNYTYEELAALLKKKR